MQRFTKHLLYRVNYPFNPNLKYKYPDPTPEILTNMMQAIGSVPRLYNQVLHLMNKMNLPPPFGPVRKDAIPATVSTIRLKYQVESCILNLGV